MTEQISLIATPLVALTLGVLFVLVLVVVHKTITDMSFFGDMSGRVVATCVAVLSVMGLLRFFGATGSATRAVSEPRTNDDVLNFVLFPYAVLLISVLLMLALRRVWPGAKPRQLDEGNRKLVVDDTRRVKKRTDNRPKASAVPRPKKEQATNHCIKT